MHANLDSTGVGVPAVDASTGEIIAYVDGPPTEREELALGGQRWDMNMVGGEILLRSRGAGSVREGFRYAARRAPLRREYAVHVRRGLGMEDRDAPLIDLPCGLTWFHFGGADYEVALRELFRAPDWAPVRHGSGSRFCWSVVVDRARRFRDQAASGRGRPVHGA